MTFNELVSSYKLSTYFKKKYFQRSKKNQVLVEYFNYKPSLINYSLLSNILAEKYEAELIAYEPNFKKLKQKILFYIRNIIQPFNVLYLYKCFGAGNLLLPNTQENKVYKIYLKSKLHLINFRFKNVMIGDLIYDDYLRKENKFTVEINSTSFKKHLNESLCLFEFWHNYLKKNNVKSIVVSHTSYNMGMIARIGLQFKIPVYVTGPIGIQRLSKKYFTKHSSEEFKKFPKIFKEFRKAERARLISISKKNLNERFKGLMDTKLLMDRSTSKVFFRIKNQLNLNLKTQKKKILIQAHQLNDAVHVYGKNLFNDFYEWLEFLGKLSEKTNYLWLLKPHPSESEINLNHFKKYVKKYKNIQLLNGNISNSELIKEKIDCVTTVYGSAGHEFPLFNIPVVNASSNGPHVGYKFNYNPKSKAKYLKLLKNLESLKVNKYSAQKIYEFYAMRYILDFTPLKNQDYFVRKFGKEFKSNFINIYLNQTNDKVFNNLINDIKIFISSKEFKLYYLKNIIK